EDDREVRRYAAAAVIKIGRDRSAAAEILKRLELDGDAQTAYQNSVDAFFDQLAERTARNRESFPAIQNDLLQMLMNGKSAQRRLAIRLLGQICPEAKVAVAELKKALACAEPETRKAAKIAIDQIIGTVEP